MLNAETIKRYSNSFDAIKEKTKDGKLTVSKKNGDMLFWLVVFCAPIFGNHCSLGGVSMRIGHKEGLCTYV